MYLLPHITPELIVLKHSVECGEHPPIDGDRNTATQVGRDRTGIWSRLMSIFS
ncbi:hypothetical protein SAMN05443245_6393 [Paraburkholderia fungorum]|uniref:Uncharacterized protein n=1 Tax=Paraburkholderia fungorum TaxID=134537 RepID=A0A1H1JHF4_9BURK|nr:hypothetical protein SAMN05443245_6393 [Paraburkholderia fungorum]